MADLPAEELAWVRKLIRSSRWIFASTYADSFPHEYVVRSRSLRNRDFDRFQALITNFGHVQWFYSQPRPYLVVDDYKYWWIFPVINRATPPSQFYGPQRGPDNKRPGEPVAYDWLAHGWDERPWVTKAEAELVQESLDFHGSVLNVGCGTGRFLTLFSRPASMYVGIDPSQGMLNRHVENHTAHLGLFPLTLAEYVEREQPEQFDAVVAMFGTADHLTEEEIRMADQLAKDQLVLMFHGNVDPIAPIHYGAIHAARELPGVDEVRYGRWRGYYRSSWLF